MASLTGNLRGIGGEYAAGTEAAIAGIRAGFGGLASGVTVLDPKAATAQTHELAQKIGAPPASSPAVLVTIESPELRERLQRMRQELLGTRVLAGGSIADTAAYQKLNSLIGDNMPTMWPTHDGNLIITAQDYREGTQAPNDWTNFRDRMTAASAPAATAAPPANGGIKAPYHLSNENAAACRAEPPLTTGPDGHLQLPTRKPDAAICVRGLGR